MIIVHFTQSKPIVSVRLCYKRLKRLILSINITTGSRYDVQVHVEAIYIICRNVSTRGVFVVRYRDALNINAEDTRRPRYVYRKFGSLPLFIQFVYRLST
jgi:hypothetical protein